MIVDTSAIVAILRRENGFEILRERLLASRELRISAGTLIEARIVVERYDGAPELDEFLGDNDIEIVPVDARHVELAHEGFRRFGKGRHSARLNFGDLFAYALARAYDEPLLFIGTDFGATDIRSALTES